MSGERQNVMRESCVRFLPRLQTKRENGMREKKQQMRRNEQAQVQERRDKGNRKLSKRRKKKIASNLLVSHDDTVLLGRDGDPSGPL